MKTKKYNARFWTPNCNCDTREDSYKACMVHSCPCGCDMSIADFLYQYYHSDLQDRYTLEEYIKIEEDYQKSLEPNEYV